MHKEVGIGMKKRGFTLIEILIVIVIIAIMALIIVPRLRSATLRAREATFAENLRQMRASLEMFVSDVGGFPPSLDYLVMRKEQAYTSIPPTDATGTTLFARGYNGPYVSPFHVPVDPFAADGEWGYDPETGRIYSTSNSISLNGTHYSGW